MVKGIILILLAPALLWLGYTQPLWHLAGIVALLAVGAGIWKIGSRAYKAHS